MSWRNIAGASGGGCRMSAARERQQRDAAGPSHRHVVARVPAAPPGELKLARQWREEAGVLRRRSAPTQADVLESCAAELESWTLERDLETMTLHQAAQESGFSYSALEKNVRRGAIINVGKKGAPRIRRGDLSRKQVPPGPQLVPDISARVLGG